ncbi:MAG: hypothetical protein ACTHJM_16420 [Marmoricola sp.]
MNKWDDESELMAALAEAVADESAVTDRARTSALAAFTWRTVDEELMELLHDSATTAGAAVRSTAAARDLVFEVEGASIDVEYADGVLTGQVSPAGGQLRLQRPESEDVSLTPDSAGFFRLEGVEAGTVRFVLEFSDVRAVTPWVRF